MRWGADGGKKYSLSNGNKSIIQCQMLMVECPLGFLYIGAEVN
jgi:hypothetical protein